MTLSFEELTKIFANIDAMKDKVGGAYIHAARHTTYEYVVSILNRRLDLALQRFTQFVFRHIELVRSMTGEATAPPAANINRAHALFQRAVQHLDNPYRDVQQPHYRLSIRFARRPKQPHQLFQRRVLIVGGYPG